MTSVITFNTQVREHIATSFGVCDGWDDQTTIIEKTE
jgi:hypothetical protein